MQEEIGPTAAVWQMLRNKSESSLARFKDGKPSVFDRVIGWLARKDMIRNRRARSASG